MSLSMLMMIMSVEDVEKRDLLLELYTQYFEKFNRFAAGFFNSSHTGEDVVQAVFTKLVKNPYLLQCDTLEKNRAYVYVMIKNYSLKKLKRDRMIQFEEDMSFVEDVDAAQSLDNIEDLLDSKEAYMAALKEIEALPKIYQDALMMRFCFNMTDQEISESLEITLNNVWVRIHRAIATLRGKMGAGE